MTFIGLLGSFEERKFTDRLLMLVELSDLMSDDSQDGSWESRGLIYIWRCQDASYERKCCNMTDQNHTVY